MKKYAYNTLPGFSIVPIQLVKLVHELVNYMYKVWFPLNTLGKYNGIRFLIVTQSKIDWFVLIGTFVAEKTIASINEL